LNRTRADLTDRMIKILENIEKEASHSQVLQPAHLLLACLLEKTGTLGEIYLKCNFQEAYLRKIFEENDRETNQRTRSDFFNVEITEDVVSVMGIAFNYMERYNQNF